MVCGNGVVSASTTGNVVSKLSMFSLLMLEDSVCSSIVVVCNNTFFSALRTCFDFSGPVLSGGTVS